MIVEVLVFIGAFVVGAWLGMGAWMVHASGSLSSLVISMAFGGGVFLWLTWRFII